MNKQIRVFAPATVANVACGFDILGFAVDFPGDEVILKTQVEPGVKIISITGDNGDLPKDPGMNTVSISILSFLTSIFPHAPFV